jgi:hypothetical protein
MLDPLNDFLYLNLGQFVIIHLFRTIQTFRKFFLFLLLLICINFLFILNLSKVRFNSLLILDLVQISFELVKFDVPIDLINKSTIIFAFPMPSWTRHFQLVIFVEAMEVFRIKALAIKMVSCPELYFVHVITSRLRLMTCSHNENRRPLRKQWSSCYLNFIWKASSLLSMRILSRSFIQKWSRKKALLI